MAEIGNHPRSRYALRYGQDMAEAELRELEARLARGEGMVVKRYPEQNTEQRVIRYRGQLVVAVYCLTRLQIKTFLPADSPLAGTGKRHRIYG